MIPVSVASQKEEVELGNGHNGSVCQSCPYHIYCKPVYVLALSYQNSVLLQSLTVPLSIGITAYSHSGLSLPESSPS